MPYEIGTALDNVDLMDRIIRFVCGYATVGAVGFTGTGDGALTLGGTYPSAGTFPATITENWTITCTAAAANGGTFSVVGSVSGAQASATVGVPYENSFVAFTIADGAIDFQVGDQFTFATTQGAMVAANSEWEFLGKANEQTAGGWMKGPGLAGTDEIFVGLSRYNNPGTDIYNLTLAGSFGFNSGLAFSNQVGFSGAVYMSAWNTTTPYWIVANGQRFVVVAKISTTYHAMHAGKILPYATPSQFGYPVYIAAETETAETRWSLNDFGFRHFTDPGAASSSSQVSGCKFAFPDGAWYGFSNYYPSSGNETVSGLGRYVWPYAGANSSLDDLIKELSTNVDGSYTLLPLILNSNTPSQQVFGEIDGCYYVGGFNNAAENIIQIDGVDYLVVQNINRTLRHHYWALKLA